MTLKQQIDQTFALGKRLLAENPTMDNISFVLTDFPVDEVQSAGKEYGKGAEFSPIFSRILFLASESCGSIYIHVRSVEVKAKVVYE